MAGLLARVAPPPHYVMPTHSAATFLAKSGVRRRLSAALPALQRNSPMQQLEAHELPLHKVFSSDFDFRIPDNQRPYT